MEEKDPDSLKKKQDADKRNTLNEEQMIKQGLDEQTQARKQRWTGNSLWHLNARQARMFDKALVLMGQGNHVGGSLLENVGLDTERTN